MCLAAAQTAHCEVLVMSQGRAVALLILFAAGCAPLPVLRLEPRGPATYDRGLAYVAEEQDSLVVLLAYERCTDSRLVFRFEAANHSSLPLLLDPSACRAVQRDSGKGSAAIDPELRLLQVDREVAQAEAARQRQLDWEVAAGLVGLICTVASFGQPRTVEHERADLVTSPSNSRCMRCEQRGDCGGLCCRT